MSMIPYALHRIGAWLRRTDGASLVEYGLLIGLIAMVCIVAVTLLGTQISNVFASLSERIAHCEAKGLVWDAKLMVCAG